MKKRILLKLNIIPLINQMENLKYSGIIRNENELEDQPKNPD